MARFRISARVQRQQSKEPDFAPILAINAGDSTVDWQSEKVLSVDQLKALFKAASDKKKITFLMQPAYAIKVFPKGRSIDFLSIEIKEDKNNNTILTPSCKDLKVIGSGGAPNHQSTVTLQLSSGGFTT
jgi:hypothetical protein